MDPDATLRHAGTAGGAGTPEMVTLHRRALRFLKRLRSPDRQIALLEQGLLAGVRLVAMVLFARIMPTDMFGAFALVVSISFILNSAQRSLVILPFILSCQKAEDPRRVGGDWWWLDLATTVVVAALLLGGWWLSHSIEADAWVQTALLFSAISAPPLMAYTFLRRWCYQVAALRSIVLMLVAHILAYGLGMVLAFVERDIEVLPFLAFAAGPAAGCLVGLVATADVMRRPSSQLLRMWRRSLRFTTWSFLSFLCGSVFTNGMNVVIAAVLGPIATGMFSATRAIVAPIVSITSAVDMIDKPRAGRAFANGGIAKLRSSVRSTLVTLLLLGAPYLLAVSIFSHTALEVLYGNKYLGLETELRLWAFAMLLQMAANPLYTHLLTLADSRSVFVCSLIAAIVTIAVALPLLEPMGLVAALLGMIFGRLTAVVLLFAATRRHHPSGTGDKAIVSEVAGAPKPDFA